MTQDILWWTLRDTALKEGNKITLYDIEVDSILRVIPLKNYFVPHLRHQKNENSEIVSSIIFKFISNNSAVNLLNPIKYAIRKCFISELITGIDTSKSELLQDFITDADLDGFDKLLIRLDYELWRDTAPNLNKLLQEHYKQNYFPLGINENTVIL